MVTVRDCQLRILSIANALTVLGTQREAPQAHQIKQLRFGLEECMSFLIVEERRAEQARSLEGTGALHSEPGDEVQTFIGDLVFHAKRLQRDVDGVFRNVALTASPTDNVQTLSDRYFETKGTP